MEKNRKIGPIIITLVIAIILIIGAVYLFASYANKNSNTDTDGIETAQMSNVPAVTSSSDDIQSLQADLDVSVQGLDDQQF